jgi:hypothetical protein
MRGDEDKIVIRIPEARTVASHAIFLVEFLSMNEWRTWAFRDTWSITLARFRML